MDWSLVESTHKEGKPRAFHPPLAAIPPGTTIKLDDYTAYQGLIAAEDWTATGAVKLRGLAITITPPSGGTGFGSDPSVTELPHPAIRLHAMMGPGKVTFRRRELPFGHDRLVLESPALLIPSRPLPKWFKLWIRAGCVPYTIVYENVDKNHLKKLLEALPTTDEGKYGLSFPYYWEGGPVDAEPGRKSKFISEFLAGKPNRFLKAQPGAFLGIAGPAVFADPQKKEVILHVAYAGSDDANPRWMNPREFLYLLFGDSSDEAKKHPLLKKLQEIGTQQLTSTPGLVASKSYVLRPPLRTFKRVEWEALQEVKNGHQSAWAKHSRLSPDRFYNDYEADRATHLHKIRQNEPKIRFRRRHGYMGWPKCNLFVSEICLRAGFRVPVVEIGKNLLGYCLANGYGAIVHGAGPLGAAPNTYPERVPLLGVPETGSLQRRRWGWKIEGAVRRARHPVEWLQDASWEEGRCLLLVTYKTGGCALHASGHVAIIQSPEEIVLLQTKTAGQGYLKFTAFLIETRNKTGIAWDEDWRIRTVSRGTISNKNSKGQPCCQQMVHVHIVELEPGLDPDHFEGLQDLMVQTSGGP